ncbi:MAG: ParB/Srx family N-terminal domain-containing protein, partial [Candidatus Limnocylindrales bacterium]
MTANLIADLRPLAFPVAELDVMVGNPRVGNVDAVARSLERFGQHRPAVARRKRGGRGEVIAGNHMLLAAR